MKRVLIAVAAVVAGLCPIAAITGGVVGACINPAHRATVIAFLWSGAATSVAFGAVNGFYVKCFTPNHKFGIVSGVVNALFAFFGITTYAASAVCQSGKRWNWTAVPFLALGSCLILHSVVVPNGRIPPALYRGTIGYGCYTFTTTALMGFFLSPLMARISRPEFGWIPAAALLLLSMASVKVSVTQPSALDQWDVVHIGMRSLQQSVLQAARGRFSKPKARPVKLAEEKWGAYQTTPRHGSPPPLKIIQITDPHMGSLMPPETLRALCAQAVEADPDFVFLTGDFFTAEGNGEPRDHLYHALEPLGKIRDRVFGSFGNHDLELPTVTAAVREVFSKLGFRLLVDETVSVPTRMGPVDVLGLNYVHRNARESHVRSFFASYRPSPGNVQTIALLHDPAGFKYIPGGLRALVLAGHTHGGLIGLFLCGLRHATIVRLFGGFDNGGFEFDSNLLYVHRGQGSRALLSNLVLRLGVPPESSVLMLTPYGP